MLEVVGRRSHHGRLLHDPHIFELRRHEVLIDHLHVLLLQELHVLELLLLGSITLGSLSIPSMCQKDIKLNDYERNDFIFKSRKSVLT